MGGGRGGAGRGVGGVGGVGRGVVGLGGVGMLVFERETGYGVGVWGWGCDVCSSGRPGAGGWSWFLFWVCVWFCEKWFPLCLLPGRSAFLQPDSETRPNTHTHTHTLFTKGKGHLVLVGKQYAYTHTHTHTHSYW